MLIIISILWGCGQGKDETKVSKKDLIIAQSGEAKSLDPHMGNDGFSLRINKQIYSRLVESDGDMNIIPGIATKWKQVTPEIMEFKIRKGVKFHNGETLTPEDIKYSFKRMIESPRISFVVPPIEEIIVVDDQTIQIKTKYPFGPLLAHLSHPALAIVNRKAIEEYGKDYNLHPIGTGPYKFFSWDAGDKITLERNQDYFGDNQYFDRMIFRSIVEETSRTIALETKETDIALSIGALDKEEIRKNKDLTLLEKPSISYSYMGFNNSKDIFKNKDLRLAINYAIDKQAIIDVVLNGGGHIATSPLAPKVFGFTDKTKAYPYNLNKAKAYMKKSGIKDLRLNLTIFEGDRNSQTAEIIQSQLKEIGIDVVIESLEVGTFWQYTASGKHDMFLGSWGCVTGDADYGLYALYNSSAKGGAGNRTFYENKDVDKLLEDGRRSVDSNERLKIYEKIQEIIVQDAPEVMLYNRTLDVGMQSNLTGLNLHPVTLHDFSTVHLK